MPIIRYTPTPVEDRTFDNLPEGTYDAEIVKAISKTSQAGNPMIALTLKVFGPHFSRKIWDNVLIGHEKMQWRFKHFMEALGKDYEAGEIDVDELPFSSVRVYVKVEKEEYQGKVREKNAIADYLPRAVASIPNLATVSDELVF